MASGQRVRRGARRVGVAAAVLALIGALNGLFGGAATAQDTAPAEILERGAEIFGVRCAICHGAAGRGIAGAGPPLLDVGAASVDFQLRTGRMPLPAPGVEPRHGPQVISDAEREALVAYVPTLGPPNPDAPEIPDIDNWQQADLPRGLELFVANCAACHGPTGAGIAVGQDDVAANLSLATPLEIAEAIRAGPGVMPRFSEEVVTGPDLEAIVRWVMALRGRDSPGGISFGRSGPVTEGLIAWVVGFGLLAIVMYLLGEKASEDDPRREPAEPAPAVHDRDDPGRDDR